MLTLLIICVGLLSSCFVSKMNENINCYAVFAMNINTRIGDIIYDTRDKRQGLLGQILSKYNKQAADREGRTQLCNS